ncbi:MAG: chemotaxis-specific protein-glutamate methyltransferase CheB [Christensenellales bacterium]|jgi:two-component system chemotaxis response regulator CheB
MAIKKKIRVLIVDDSLFMRSFIAAQLEKDAALEVAGVASDPYEARDKILELNPDVMTLDIEMPKMNGVEFLKRLMPQHPLPVVVVSSAAEAALDALDAGALDFVSKADMKSELERKHFISELIVKIKVASIARLGGRKNAASKKSSVAPDAAPDKLLIAAAASTGGTDAVHTLLKALGDDVPGIVIVQHMPPGFTRLYAERLNSSCAMEVREAKDKDDIIKGRAYIAPGGMHMKVEKTRRGYRVRCFEGEKVSGHCPSGDVLFNSVAEAAGKNALGIILTGMGADGAKGLLNMKNAGAATIGQSRESCVVFGMPKVAGELGATDRFMDIEDMSGSIYQWLGVSGADKRRG